MKYGLDASKEFSDFLRERYLDGICKSIPVRFTLNLNNIFLDNTFLIFAN